MPTVIINSPGHSTGMLQGASAPSASFRFQADAYITIRRSASAGPVLVTKSVDGGSTFTPMASQPLDRVTPSAAPADIGLNVPFGLTGSAFMPAEAGALYRLEAGEGMGAAVFAVDANRHCQSWGVLGLVEPGEPLPQAAASAYAPKEAYIVTMSAAKAKTLHDTMFTDPGSLSGDLTLYKRGSRNEIITLSVPAAAQRARSLHFLLGSLREIRAEYVNVISITDPLGNPLTNASSRFDQSDGLGGSSGTRYTVGETVVHRDVRGTSTGAFTDSTYEAGIHGFPTLIEAVANHWPWCGPSSPDLAALGA